LIEIKAGVGAACDLKLQDHEQTIGRSTVLTFQDCLDFANLTSEEVDAIAEHEHVPEMVALELGRYLCETPEGERRISRMILDDIEEARKKGDLAAAARLRLVLRDFLMTHPCAAAVPPSLPERWAGAAKPGRKGDAMPMTRARAAGGRL
jgi:hypothetical protein